MNQIFSLALFTFYVKTYIVYANTSMETLEVYLCMEEITQSLQQ